MILLALVAALLGTAQTEAHLAAVASDLSGRPASVWCHRFEWVPPDGDPASGYFDGVHIHLSPLVCKRLRAFRARRPSLDSEASVQAADAALTLAHETAHLAGIANEAAADCWGLRRLPLVLHRLGASRAYALTLGRGYATVFPQCSR